MYKLIIKNRAAQEGKKQMLNITPNLRTYAYLLLTFGVCNPEHISIGKYIDRKTDKLQDLINFR